MAALCLAAQVSPILAQGTIRPIPSVAHTWEARSLTNASATRKEVPGRTLVDLDFIGPLELKRPRDVPDREPQRTYSFAELDLWLEGIGSSGFQGGQGSLTTQRGGWKVAVGEETLDAFSFAVEVGTEASFYDYGGASSPISGVNDPFNDLYDTHLAGRFQWQTGERVAVYGGVEVGVAGEDAVTLDDSGYLGGAGAVRYEASPDFALLVGIAGVSRFDDSPWILPYIGFDWQVTERLRLKTEAAEIHADYRFAKHWSVGFDAVYDFRQYRLNKEGPLNGGSFRDEEIRAGAVLRWHMTEHVALRMTVGKMLWREVRFSDGNTGDLGETELSSPVYAGIGMKVSF